MRRLAESRTPARSQLAVRMSLEHGRPIWNERKDEFRAEQPVLGAVAGVLASAADMLSGAITHVLKEHHERVRPSQQPGGVKPLGGAASGSSFSSGHTATAFANTTVLGAFQPDRRDELEREAVEMGQARMYTGAHYPSDVQAGAAIGQASAAAVLAGSAGLVSGGLAGAAGPRIGLLGGGLRGAVAGAGLLGTASMALGGTIGYLTAPSARALTPPQ